jgi:hypothetical protein
MVCCAFLADDRVWLTPSRVAGLCRQDGVGVHHFWGFSPAVDLVQLHDRALEVGSTSKAGSESSDAPLCVLLVMPGDPRSLIKTIAQRMRHTRRALHVGRALPGVNPKRACLVTLLDAARPCCAAACRCSGVHI